MIEIIVIRHGAGKSNGLTPNGIKQITYAAEKMKDVVRSRRIYLASSEKDRAILSAKIVKRVLRLDNNSVELGCLESNTHYDAFFDCIGSRNKDVGIIIAHGPFVENLPNYMVKKYGYEVEELREKVENGFGYHIDRGNRFISFFPWG